MSPQMVTGLFTGCTRNKKINFLIDKNKILLESTKSIIIIQTNFKMENHGKLGSLMPLYAKLNTKHKIKQRQ